ncbi:fimbrial protein [Kosakonia radicincitans]|uniref:fimbrial protein n=1 Tax=Kosakonia radicincitans TaxID=283686 RepID=UPI0005C2D798|nr:fimbrial protein [Kosakonia radicincitans]KIS42263.1 fimbrial family protein [Kosakonia radicincitans YD4]
MKRSIFITFSLMLSIFHSTAIYAAGCSALASGIGADGNKREYRLNSPLIAIDPNAPVGEILWSRNIDTSGNKWACNSTAQRQYESAMGPAYSTVIGSNSKGNIYATGVEGLGVQITDLYQPNRSVPNKAWPTAQQTLNWASNSYTRVDFIKVGKIGSGTMPNGSIATYKMDGVTVMTVSAYSSTIKIKSCTIDGGYNRTINLGRFNARDINPTSKDVPFTLTLTCQADFVPVYVQFDALSGSSGDGLLNIDSTGTNPATGVAVEIVDAYSHAPVKLGQESKYHMNSETAIYISLAARYKKIASTITPGLANAGMTITINER